MFRWILAFLIKFFAWWIMALGLLGCGDPTALTSRCESWDQEWSYSRMDEAGAVSYVEGCAPPEEHGEIMRRCFTVGCGEQALPVH